MALGNRLVQNIDLQADVGGLLKAIQSLGKQASTYAETIAKAGSDTSGLSQTSRQLKSILQQAQQLQNVVDGIASKKGGKLLGDIDTQRLGKTNTELGKIRQNIDSVGTASGTLERRLVDVNKRFAAMYEAGRTPTSRELSRQFKIKEAASDLKSLEAQFRRMSGASLNTPMKGQSVEMQKLRGDIDKAYVALQKFAAKGSSTNFTSQIEGIRALQIQFQKLTATEMSASQASAARALQAQETARKIITATDAERNATLRRESSKFSFPGIGASPSVALLAEQRLAMATANRLRLVNMIEAAQARGAPTRSVERLNTAYGSLNKTMAADLALIKQVNKELANTPEAKGKRINEHLFGDGGASFTKRIAGAAVIGSGVFAAINSVQNSLKFVVQFEDSLKQLQAISGSTDRQMVSMAESITSVGRESKFSTLEIAKSATVIAQAGYAATELDTVLKASVALSTASGSTPDQAVDTLTSALGAFRLQASDSVVIVDTLVTALNKTKLNIEQVQLAIQYAGATAEQTNTSFGELVTLAASLAQAGIKRGSVIGTGLRQQQEQFLDPSKKFVSEITRLGLTLDDIDPKLNSHMNIVKKLTQAGFSAAAAYETLGTRGAASFLALSNQIPVYDELALAVARGGSAAEAQEKALDSLSSQSTIFLNTAAELATVIGKPLMDSFKVLLKIINGTLGLFVDVVKVFADAVGGSEILSAAIKTLGGAWLGYITVMKIVSSVTIPAALSGFAAMAGPIGITIGLVLGLASAYGSMSDKLDDARTKFLEMDSTYTSHVNKTSEVESAIDRIIDRQGELKDGSNELALETINLSKQFVDLQSEILNTDGSYQKLLNTMINYNVEQRKLQGTLAESKVAAAQDVLKIESANTNKAARGDKLTSFTTGSPFYKSSKEGRAAIDQLRRLENIDFTKLSPEYLDRIYRKTIDIDTQLTKAGTRGDFTNASDAIRLGNYAVSGAMKAVIEKLNTLRSTQGDIKVGQIQINQAKSLTSKDYVSREKEIYGSINRSRSTNKKTSSAGFSELGNHVTVLNALIASVDESSSEYAAYVTLLSKVKGRVEEQGFRQRKNAEALEGTTGPKKTTTGNPIADIREAARYAKAEGFTVGRIGRNGVSTGAGHQQGRAVDINSVEGNDASNPRAKAKLDALALKYQKNGYTVLWNKKRYGADGSITSIPSGQHQHTNHLHVEAPQYGVTVGGVASIGEGANTAEEKKAADEARDLFSLQKARASNKVGNVEAGITTILKQARAGKYSPSDLKARLDASMAEFLAASLEKFDVSNPVEDLTKSALEERSLARQELQGELTQKIAGFKADLDRRIADYVISEFELSLQQIGEKLEDDTYLAEAPVRAAEFLQQRTSSKLNRRGNADSGTQYYIEKTSERARLGADQDTLGLRTAAEAKTKDKISGLQGEYDAKSAEEKQGEAAIDLLEKITQYRRTLNDEMAKTAELQSSINARTQAFVALPLNERLQYGAQAWLENSGAMDSYKDVLANNLAPALDMVTDGLTGMFSQLITGKATIKEALGSFLSSIGDFIAQLIARALALAAIKWFLALIGIEVPAGFGDLSSGSVGNAAGRDIGSARAMTGGSVDALAGPRKFMDGGSVDGYISQGVSNRDGVAAYLARNEFVMRGSAVNDVGIDVMSAINKHGSEAISAMGQKNIITPQAKQETNVYVVKPDEKPRMGPNDVLVIINDDILQGGQTKQLIKQVAQGG